MTTTTKWTFSKNAQRSMAAGSIGAVAGAYLWKSHRVWGFILGWIGGGAVGTMLFAEGSSMELPLPSSTGSLDGT